MKFEQTKEVLNQLVADLSQFSVVIHQTHWYMRGPEFLTLHPKMDEYMDQINDQLDVISERLITLDGAPYSTLQEFADHTGISDEIGTYERTIPERMEKLVEGYRYLADLYQKGIEVSGEEGDDSTQDIFIANKTDIEKNIWMLQAKLGKAPGIDADSRAKTR
ncbi:MULTISPECIES: Dps family protein [Enterococcus]|uniref:Dps family protein n=3 Tax=Enterococcus TaxID=1350 RepID=R2SQA8_9ENTE|nr:MULTISPECIES: Dps family protein [Enterococcus]ALS02483.1 DNA starvation/stationary phase protection protein [Enterococcus silesiacus]EOH94951.1 dps family protein [Enterococcus haemoperoxidus ATCC BAA-382]EOT60350.1 dps family protein [Enterococcus haemoperoxidus ATCC BAA-382]MBO0421364.1 DNA starvation/stationary phase protection protein [Enterococcus plantarum]MBO0466829.1 DNA starvation/stationary phase protection protein [Enterococcus plantarum]